MGGRRLSVVLSEAGVSGSAGARGVPAAARAETDEALAARAALGDREAFGELVGRHQAMVYRFAMARVRHAEDAAETTQDTFLRAWRSIGRFDPQRSFVTWVMAIARHRCIDVIRTRARAPASGYAGDEHAEERGGEEPVRWTGVWETARRALDDRAFEVVWLRYAEDLTPAQIARVTGRTAVGVRVALHRARLRLQRALGDEGGGA